jgi:uncharacterized membrane protein
MELPALKLPVIELPFDIPTLMHPPVDHLAIAIPILVLFIEIINLITKKRALGVLSFVLLLIGAVAVTAAYFTGVHDGKEVFDALTQAGQSELKTHKLLGSYLVIASIVVLVFKLLSALIKKGMMKILYFLVLLVFVAFILKQGKDGGELVYTHGANVQRVADIDSELFDTKEELDELKEKMKSTSEKAAEQIEAVKETVNKAVDTVAKKTSEAAEDIKENTSDVAESIKESTTEAVKAMEEKGTELMDAAKEKAAEVKEQITPSVPKDETTHATEEVTEPQIHEGSEAVSH